MLNLKKINKEYKDNLLVIPQLKESYGPMMRSLLKSGIKLVKPNDCINVKSAIWFNSTPPPKLGCKTGWYMCDLRKPESFQRVKLDMIFLCNTHFKKAYEKYFDAKVYYMPQCGFDDDMTKGRDLGADIIFIGGITHEFHTNRGECIDALKNYNFKHIQSENGGFTKDQKYIYRKTPISLAVSPQYGHYTSNRLYNILSSSGFCLTLWFPGIENLFVNKKHLVWFKDTKEMTKLIDYYLKNPKERSRIAEYGNKLYLARHTGEHRISKMIELLEK